MSRFYKYNGKKLPSVTTITGQLDKSGPLTHWAANCCADYILQEINELSTIQDVYPIVESARKNFRKVSAQALDTGSAVHQAIEHYLKTGQEPQAPSDQVLSAFLAFLEWWGDDKEVLSIEETIYQPESPAYAGTQDLKFWWVGQIWILDFKASKGIYPEHTYQIAGYRQCQNDVEGCGILRLDKETGYPEWKDTSDTYKQDLKVFMTLAELWWLRHPNHK